MTSTLIVERLASEFSIRPEQVRSTLEMIDAGLAAPFIGRVRREATGGLSEGGVRRLAGLRAELEELDRRRGTILRILEGPTARAPEPDPAQASAGAGAVALAPAESPESARFEGLVAKAVPPAVLEQVRSSTDRFELEDLFLPYRRPEPEVQLALDRGLGALADRLVAPLPPELRPKRSEPEPAPAEESQAVAAERDSAPDEDAAVRAEGEPAPETPGEELPADPTPEDAGAEPEGHPHAEEASEAGAEAAGAGEAPPIEASAAEAHRNAELEALLHGQIELTPELARVSVEHVSPDRGIHTEADALAGAMRILSDRLGRDTRLRGQIRQLLRKQGALSVRAMVDEKRLGRHKGLLKLKQPLRQVQGHRLLAIRQAQKERVLTTVVTLKRELALPKVRAALGKHTDPAFAGVLDAVALRTLEYRLLPLLEADVRLELKERADEEALRFLSQHLRQLLLTPPVGQRPLAGLDVNAKGDWTVAIVDEHGALAGPVARIEVGEKDDASLAAELGAALRPEGHAPVALAFASGKAARTALLRVRALLAQAGLDLPAIPVNEAGLSSYASSEIARRELTELTVPQRMAVSLARRLQDPLNELIKVDPRHLALGSEQGLVSKANLRRAFDETIESCVAHVGCDVNRAPPALLARIPGLDEAAAARLVARRAERPFESREELRAEGLLSEAQWITAVAFLRVSGSREPLDATSLHPEQYALARSVIESAGGTVEDSLGKPGLTKGLRRVDFGVEEHVWRDLMRELWHPGRDPRPRQFRPELLDPQADPATLAVGRVVEGVVSSVASFGAFVYVGLEQDAMIHVSEISRRYVRDARELVSVGQAVRACIKEAGGQRLALSLKDVPETPREQRARPSQREGRAPREERGRRERRGERESMVPIRAAQSRRDGLGGSSRGKGRGRGAGGGRSGDRDRDRGPGAERLHPDELRSISGGATSYNPFATFFKKSSGAANPPAAESGQGSA